MKRLTVFALVIGVITGSASAQFIDQGGGGQAELVKERAIKVTSPGQGAAPQSPGAAAAPATPSAPPPLIIPGPRTISAAQQENIDKLNADLTAIKPGTDIADEKKQQIQQDILNVCKGGTKPSKAVLTKLSADLSTALASKDVTAADQADLSRDLNILVNSAAANLTYEQIHDFITSAQSALRTVGVGPEQVSTVGHDLKAMTSELQKSKPKLFQ